MSWLHQWSTPGFSTVRESIETQVWRAGRYGHTGLSDQPFVVLSTARDAGNDPTTTIRAGTIMARSAVSPANTIVPIGQNLSLGQPVGVLPYTINVLDYTATAGNKPIPLLRSGLLYTNELLTGAYDTSPAGDVQPSELLLAQLNNLGFFFDDQELHGTGITRAAVNAATTVAEADIKHGTQLTVGSASTTTVTMPEIIARDQRRTTTGTQCHEGFTVRLVGASDATGAVTINRSGSNTFLKTAAASATSLTIDRDTGPIHWLDLVAVQSGAECFWLVNQ